MIIYEISLLLLNGNKIRIGLEIFKLYGSLYWFGTKNSKFIKLPIKGLNSRGIKYISDEILTEMPIHPTIEKEKYLQVYTTLENHFTNKIDKYDLCIIIGYSFRDKDITGKIVESVKTNPHLWLLIINHNSTVIEKMKNQLNEEQLLRMVVINNLTESMFSNITLRDIVRKLIKNIHEEESYVKQSIRCLMTM